MKTKILAIVLTLVLTACASKKGGSVADDYGYSEKNPIKVGGISNGPAMERQFLNNLTGPNGEPVTYERRGSCCAFDSDNSPYGMGMLDIYEVTIEGEEQARTLYLNMYESAKVYPPKGFGMK